MNIFKKLRKPLLAGLDAFIREIPVIGKVYTAVADSLGFKLPDVVNEDVSPISGESSEVPVISSEKSDSVDIKYTDV